MIRGTNPILGMDYPDPDVIRIDDTYYMVTTTMHFFPGCEILRSYDLINWEHLTYVYDTLDSTEAQRLTGDKHIFGKGMWAASLRYHKGVFYIVFVANDTHKTYLYRAENIEGPWRKSEIKGFYHDASLLFDEERVFIVYGNTDIYLTELNKDMTGPLEGGLHRLIVSDKGNPMLGYEGSHIYRINGRYYLFLIHSARDKWMRREAFFSSDSLEGDFTGGDVLSDDMGRPGMGAAQGGIVDDIYGNWNAVVFQDCGAVGRIPVVVPVTWKEDTPIFGIDAKVPMKLSLPSMKPDYKYKPLYGSDDFKGGLKDFWQFSHEPDMKLIDIDKKRAVFKVTTDKLCTNIHQARNVLTQRMKYPDCSGEVSVSGKNLKDGDMAGLAVYQGNYIWAGITRRNGQLYALTTSFTSKEDTWTLSTEPGKESELIPLDTDELRVKLSVAFTGPDEKNTRDEAKCSIYKDGKWTDIGPSHELSFRLDYFTGARFGLFIYSTKETGGSAEFTDFVYK